MFFKNAQVGRGTAIHRMSPDGAHAICGAGVCRVGTRRSSTVHPTGASVTCRRCLQRMEEADYRAHVYRNASSYRQPGLVAEGFMCGWELTVYALDFDRVSDRRYIVAKRGRVIVTATPDDWYIVAGRAHHMIDEGVGCGLYRNLQEAFAMAYQSHVVV